MQRYDRSPVFIRFVDDFSSLSRKSVFIISVFIIENLFHIIGIKSRCRIILYTFFESPRKGFLTFIPGSQILL